MSERKLSFSREKKRKLVYVLFERERDVELLREIHRERVRERERERVREREGEKSKRKRRRK